MRAASSFLTKKSETLANIFKQVVETRKTMLGIPYAWRAMTEAELIALSDKIMIAISEQMPSKAYPSETQFERELKSWKAQINQCRKITVHHKNNDKKILSQEAARNRFAITIQKSILSGIK